MRALVATTATEQHLPSIAWGVVRDGALVDGDLVDTVYRIASMTKSFTTAVVLALRDEGVWSLDDPVSLHAPELATVHGPDGSPPITLRHLLSMSAGMATDDAWADRHLDMTPAEIDRIYAAGPTFAHRTGTTFEYSNLGFGMLGRAVLRATGRTAQQHVTERFLEPLGMRRTTWVQPAHDDWARPFRVQDDEVVPDGVAPLGDGEIAPMGGLWSTVSDLTRWVSWLDAANRPGAADHLLRASSRREMQSPHTWIGVTELAGRHSPGAYGFGLNIRHDSVYGPLVGHSGGLPGYGSNMRWLPGTGVGTIALSNSTYATMSAFTLHMLDVVHASTPLAAVRPTASPALLAAAEQLVRLLCDWDDASAEALFADNVDLDEALPRRRNAAAQLVVANGPLTLVSVEPAAATRGTVTVQGERGATLQIEVELSPEPTPRLQSYRVRTA